jgi:hypothetical protein
LVLGRGGKLVERSVVNHGDSNRILFGASLARPLCLVNELLDYLAASLLVTDG